MYLEKTLIKKLIGTIVTNADDIGDIVNNDKIFEPGFSLDEEWGITIENKVSFHNMDNFKQLIGLKLADVQEEKNKFIKFIFEKNKFIEVDMSHTGFDGPEAVIIGGKNNYLWVVRTWMIKENDKYIEIFD